MAAEFTKTNRSAFTNFLRSKYEMFTAAETVSALPYYLCFDPSDTCQLRCPTCPTGIENESKKQKDAAITLYRADRKKLDIGLFDSVLDELGENLFLIMFYNYGEPLLNPRLHEFIAKATAKRIATEVHSNLSLPLSDQRIEQLLTAGVGRISASVDGFSQEAYEIHRVGGDVELVQNNLRRMAIARDRLGLDTEILYKYLIFKHNEHEVESARKFAEDIGVIFAPGDAFIHDQSWLPSYRESEKPFCSTQEFSEITERWKSAGRDDYFFEHETHPFWNIVPKEFEEILPKTCSWHYGYSVITAGGPVAPCCAVSKDKDDFGTIVPGETSFADIWNNDLYRKSRLAMVGEPPESLNGVDSTCTRCYFPKLVHHLYNNNDVAVAARFSAVFGTTEPEMLQAFALLGNSFNNVAADEFVAHYEQFREIIESPREQAPEPLIAPQTMITTETASNILASFGARVKALGVNGSKVFDDSLLKHSKDDILAAINSIVNGQVVSDKQDFAREAALVLAFFQPGVGDSAIDIDEKRIDQETWRNSVEAEMQNNAQHIAAGAVPG